MYLNIGGCGYKYRQGNGGKYIERGMEVGDTDEHMHTAVDTNDAGIDTM